MMSQACPINGYRRFWRGREYCSWRTGKVLLKPCHCSSLEPGAEPCMQGLVRECFRLPFRGGSEVNRGQKSPDQHYQQTDFHVTLRCAIAALTATMQKAFQPVGPSPLQ